MVHRATRLMVLQRTKKNKNDSKDTQMSGKYAYSHHIRCEIRWHTRGIDDISNNGDCTRLIFRLANFISFVCLFCTHFLSLVIVYYIVYCFFFLICVTIHFWMAFWRRSHLSAIELLFIDFIRRRSVQFLFSSSKFFRPFMFCFYFEVWNRLENSGTITKMLA